VDDQGRFNVWTVGILGDLEGMNQMWPPPFLKAAIPSMYELLKVNITYSNEYNKEDNTFMVVIQPPDQFDTTRQALASFCFGVQTEHFRMNDEVTTRNEPQADHQRATTGSRVDVRVHLQYTGSFKKIFTTLSAYIHLMRGHVQCFELS
jgi:hypothetical protein